MSDEVDRIADWLVAELKSPSHRPLFLKAAWRISLKELQSFLFLSSGARSPRAYFIKLVKAHPNYQNS